MTKFIDPNHSLPAYILRTNNLYETLETDQIDQMN